MSSPAVPSTPHNPPHASADQLFALSPQCNSGTFLCYSGNPHLVRLSATQTCRTVVILSANYRTTHLLSNARHAIRTSIVLVRKSTGGALIVLNPMQFFARNAHANNPAAAQVVQREAAHRMPPWPPSPKRHHLLLAPGLLLQ